MTAAKKRLIPAGGKPYLAELGVTDADGNVLKTSGDKFRQINRYVEILAPLLKAIPAGPAAQASSIWAPARAT